MKFAFHCLTVAVAILAAGCGTSSTTTTGPSLDRCGITVVNSMSSVGASGGTGRLAVTAGRECTWSMTSNVPWIAARQPASGQGDGGVEYVVAANTTPDSRRGTVVVGGQVFEVVQEGLACQFELRPNNQNVEAEGGSGSFTVEGQDGCTWTPAASDEWITITNGGSRTGSDAVNFTVARNTGAARTGAIRVGAQAFSISQSAPQCRYQLSPITTSIGGGGGSGSVTVTAAGNCTWTATASVPWISIVGGTNGTGNGTVSFTVQPNPGAARNGVLNIGGQRFTVTQQQAECNYSIAPAGQSFAAAGGQGSVTLSTASVCTWTTSDVPAWITGVPPSGTGTQTIAFTVDPNPGPARTVVMIIGGQSFTVSQSGGCTYSLAPGSHSASASGGASSVAVTTAAGCEWTSSGAPSWVVGIPASGTGPTTINFAVAANPDRTPRTANVVIGGQTFAVSQAAAAAVPCSYVLDSPSYSAPASGGSSSVAVKTGATCNWTTSDVPPWITVMPPSGMGPTTINVTVALNPDPTPRSATIMIGGQPFMVSQAAAAVPCSYVLDSPSYSAPASGGSSSVAVKTGATCNWTTSDVPPWITVMPPSGMGPTTINVTVALNPDPTPRSATIMIGGQPFMVSQAAAAVPCSYVLDSPSYSAPASGGSSSVAVKTGATCNWTTGGVPPWITVMPPSGTGPTTINVTVALNPDPTPRSATIMIGGQPLMVSQAAAAVPCSYVLDSPSYSAPASGGSSSVAVKTGATCNWTTGGVPPWITVMPPSGTGPTTINVTVALNPDPTPRSATIMIGGQPLMVSQAAAAVPCSYVLDSPSYSAPASGGSSSVAVKTGATCNWTTSDVPPWITVMPPSGTGPTTINVTVALNLDPTPRSATIMIGGQPFMVSQAAAAVPCSYVLDSPSYSAPASGGSSSVAVKTGATCNWTTSDVPPWITVMPPSGTGPTTINVTVALNPDPTPRSATIMIGGQPFMVSQAAAAVPCSYVLDSPSYSAPASGGSSSVAVKTGATCNWTTSDVPPWITVMPPSGTGPTTINVTVALNPDPTPRSATIMIGGQTFTVSQAGP